MTDELKQKLNELLFPLVEDADNAGYAGGPMTSRKKLLKECEVISKQITQAFIDAGWVKEKRYYLVPPLGSDGEISLISQQELDNVGGEAVPVMTGQEWYDRLVKETEEQMDKVHSTPNLSPQFEKILTAQAIDTAAKKAAGLPELGEQS